MKRVALSAFLIAIAFAAPVYAQTTPTENERQIGNTDCKNGASSSDFDTLAQCTSTSSSTGTMQKSPMFVGKVTSPPYASTTCDSNKAGLIQWTGTSFLGCDGSAWSPFRLPDCTDDSTAQCTLAATRSSSDPDFTAANIFPGASILGVSGAGPSVAAKLVIHAGRAPSTCAVKTDGTAWCWGYNSNGQLGNNSTTQSNYPSLVLDVYTFSF